MKSLTSPQSPKSWQVLYLFILLTVAINTLCNIPQTVSYLIPTSPKSRYPNRHQSIKYSIKYSIKSIPSLPTSLYFSSASSSDDPTSSPTPSIDEDDHKKWLQRLDSAEVAFVRNDLIERYTTAGHLREKAEIEVDNFLRDRSRSEKFLDMRKMALEQEVGQWSPELGLWLGLAFMAGMVGNVAPKIWEGFNM